MFIGADMNKQPIPIATIALDRPDHARGSLLLIHTAAGIEIEGLTPDGIESPAFPAFASYADAQEAITAAYGGGAWALDWDEMGCRYAERLAAGRGVDPVHLAAELYGGHATTASAPGSWIITFGGEDSHIAATTCTQWLALAVPGQSVHLRGAAPWGHQVWVGVV